MGDKIGANVNRKKKKAVKRLAWADEIGYELVEVLGGHKSGTSKTLDEGRGMQRKVGLARGRPSRDPVGRSIGSFHRGRSERGRPGSTEDGRLPKIVFRVADSIVGRSSDFTSRDRLSRQERVNAYLQNCINGPIFKFNRREDKEGEVGGRIYSLYPAAGTYKNALLLK